MDDLLRSSATELMEFFRSGQASPTDAFRAATRQMDQTEPAINAVITQLGASAEADAEESTRRYHSGTPRALEGVPIGVKDIIATFNAPTTGGSSMYREWVPEADASVVARLRAAGAVIMAKNSLFAFALGDENNRDLGTTRNPWDPARTPGGSSSGSGAAVAARQVPISIGTDTGGSIRVPASWCGVAGLKPTWGRVPTRGVMPLAWSMDTVGPLARSVWDLAIVLEVISGYDPSDSTSNRRPSPALADELTNNIRGLRVGIPENWFFELCDPQITRAVEEAGALFADAGAELVHVAFPHADLTQAIGWFTILGELASLHQDNAPRLSEYDPIFAGHIVNGSVLSSIDYLRCQRLRSVVQSDYEAAFEKCDVILTPGNSSYAPRLDDMMCRVGDLEYFWYEVAARCTFSANITGIPALALPAGLGYSGLPLGIQLLARPFEEGTLLRAGRAYQAVTEHHLLEPNLQREVTA